jgi:hypothetical protein
MLHLNVKSNIINKIAIVSEILQLNDDSGFNKIKGVISVTTLKDCRKDC